MTAGRARPNWLRRKAARLRLFEPRFGEAATRRPETIRLAPDPAAPAAPPLELWVTTAPEELGAVRTLVAAVDRLRAPGRAVTMRLVSNLAGLPRGRWATPWEGYRAAVPGLASGGGRAVVCTAETVFLEDPGALLALDMGGAAWLAGPDRRGPALLDLDALAPVWRLEDLRRGVPPAEIEARAPAGPLPAVWTQGPDAAGTAGAAILPAAARRGESPLARLRREQAEAADAAGLRLFTRERPSAEFHDLLELYRRMHDAGAFPGQRLKHHLDPVRALIAETGARTLLDYGAGKAEGYARLPGEPEASPLRAVEAWPGVVVRCYDPGVAAFADPGSEAVDGVISTDVLEHLSPWDVPWVLDEMFARARRFVFAVAACYPAVKTLPDGRNAHSALMPHDWWRARMREAARARPGPRWRLGCDDRTAFRKWTTIYDD